MKTSVSIPDDLWNAVNDESSGPSEIVQRGLRALAAQQREEARPMANAPDQKALSKYEQSFNAAVQTVSRSLREVLDRGYRAGLAIAAGLDTSDFDLLESSQRAIGAARRMFLEWGDTVEVVDEDPNSFSRSLYSATGTWLDTDISPTTGGPDEPVDGVVWEYDVETETALPRISDTFARGLIDALIDVRDASLRAIDDEGTPDEGQP